LKYLNYFNCRNTWCISLWFVWLHWNQGCWKDHVIFIIQLKERLRLYSFSNTVVAQYIAKLKEENRRLNERLFNFVFIFYDIFFVK
jgi:hypothetical protein